MFFARYIGEDNQSFINGKVYVARPENEYSDVVCFGVLEIKNEFGENEKVEDIGESDAPYPEWEFLEKIYAVILHGTDDFEKGAVVLVTDVEDNGGSIFYTVCGQVKLPENYLTLLDLTNIHVGMRIMKESNRVCQAIVEIGDNFEVKMEDGNKYFLDEFYLSIGESGEIQDRFSLTCAYDVGVELTEGKTYVVESEGDPSNGEQGLVYIRDDVGELNGYFKERFFSESSIF